MKWVFSILLFVFSVARAQKPSEVRPEIIFENQIEISAQEKINLGDLVQVKNPSTKLLESLEKFGVEEGQFRAGLNAQSVREIYKKLVQQFPSVAEENPKLVVPQKIQVQTSPGFSQIHFKRKLQNYLSAQCAPCEISIEKTTLPQSLSADGQVHWSEVKLSPSVLIAWSSGAATSPPSPQWISVTVKVHKIVIVSRRNINFGERISEADFDAKLLDISYAKEEPVTFADLKNYQMTARPLMKGRGVFPSDLKREPGAARGQIVKALVGTSDFEITLSAVAEEGGQVGDLIKVKNNETKKIMSALIVEKGVVRIQ